MVEPSLRRPENPDIWAEAAVIWLDSLQAITYRVTLGKREPSKS